MMISNVDSSQAIEHSKHTNEYIILGSGKKIEIDGIFNRFLSNNGKEEQNSSIIMKRENKLLFC